VAARARSWRELAKCAFLLRLGAIFPFSNESPERSATTIATRPIIANDDWKAQVHIRNLAKVETALTYTK